jgi:hypothetical protein
VTSWLSRFSRANASATVATKPPASSHQPGRPRQHRRRQPAPRPRPAADAQATSDGMNDFAGSLAEHRRPAHHGCERSMLNAIDSWKAEDDSVVITVR